VEQSLIQFNKIREIRHVQHATEHCSTSEHQICTLTNINITDVSCFIFPNNNFNLYLKMLTKFKKQITSLEASKKFPAFNSTKVTSHTIHYSTGGCFLGCSASIIRTMIMDVARGSETSVRFYQTTRRYNPEDSHLHIRRSDNLKPYLIHYKISPLELPMKELNSVRKFKPYCFNIHNYYPPYILNLLSVLLLLQTFRLTFCIYFCYPACTIPELIVLIKRSKKIILFIRFLELRVG
jgi:hypothetical protein